MKIQIFCPIKTPSAIWCEKHRYPFLVYSSQLATKWKSNTGTLSLQTKFNSTELAASQTHLGPNYQYLPVEMVLFFSVSSHSSLESLRAIGSPPAIRLHTWVPRCAKNVDTTGVGWKDAKGGLASDILMRWLLLHSRSHHCMLQPATRLPQPRITWSPGVVAISLCNHRILPYMCTSLVFH